MASLYARTICVAACALVLAASAQASTDTIGPNGINSVALGLTGAGVVIGQVEQARPGDVDIGDDPNHSNTTTDPAGVFEQDNPGVPPDDDEVRNHAQEVAGVIISSDATDGVGVDIHGNPLTNGIAPTGVAMGASLYSSAYITTGVSPGYDHAILTFQFVATRPGMRAVNHSWGKPTADPNNTGPSDGNSQLTLALDWSASQHDVLHLVAGNQGPMANLPIPKDNFNGMTIARSSKVGGVYRQVSSGNNYSRDAAGSRTSIDLIAPGDGIELTGLGNAHRITAGGTSYATPHVTGTVALLQEFAIQTAASDPNWGPNAHRHEVMKAVLMNSADKIEGILGMERTVLKQNGTDTWFESAAIFPQTPLDMEMGTGHLNANRALQQFTPGEIDGTTSSFFENAPLIGWDFDSIGFSFIKYNFDIDLEAGDYVSATLAWDRVVNLTNVVGASDEYDQGDSFSHGSLAGLDLYLTRQGDGISNAVASSTSFDSSVEHIFAEVPEAGKYSLIVASSSAGPTDYGIAWWSGGVVAPLTPGDFDMDGDVDADDLSQWEGDYGINGDSDADDDGDSDGADFLVWQQNFGTGAALTANATAVPEPATWLLLAIGIAFWRPRSSSNRVSQ